MADEDDQSSHSDYEADDCDEVSVNIKLPNGHMTEEKYELTKSFLVRQEKERIIQCERITISPDELVFALVNFNDNGSTVIMEDEMQVSEYCDQLASCDYLHLVRRGEAANTPGQPVHIAGVNLK